MPINITLFGALGTMVAAMVMDARGGDSRGPFKATPRPLHEVRHHTYAQGPGGYDVRYVRAFYLDFQKLYHEDRIGDVDAVQAYLTGRYGFHLLQQLDEDSCELWFWIPEVSVPGPAYATRQQFWNTLRKFPGFVDPELSAELERAITGHPGLLTTAQRG